MPSDDDTGGLVSPGTDVDSTDSGGSGSPPPTSASGGFNSWSKNKKLAVLGGGGIVLGGLAYLLLHKKSSSSSTSSTGTTPTLVLPNSNQDAQLSSGFAGLSNQLSQLLSQSGNPGGGTTTPTPTGTPTPVSNGGTPGQQYISGNANAGTANTSGVGNPFNLGVGSNPGDTLSFNGQTYQPYVGSLANGAPVGSVAGYQDVGSGVTYADTVISPGTIQEVNTATGQAVGNPYLSPSAAGYYTGAPTPYSGGGIQPGQVLVNGMVYTERANSTGGYG